MLIFYEGTEPSHISGFDSKTYNINVPNAIPSGEYPDVDGRLLDPYFTYGARFIPAAIQQDEITRGSYLREFLVRFLYDDPEKLRLLARIFVDILHNDYVLMRVNNSSFGSILTEAYLKVFGDTFGLSVCHLEYPCDLREEVLALNKKGEFQNFNKFNCMGYENFKQILEEYGGIMVSPEELQYLGDDYYDPY